MLSLNTMTYKEIQHLYWRAGFGLQPKALLELSSWSKEAIINDLFQKSKDINPLKKDLSYLKAYSKEKLKNDKALRQELGRRNREETKVLNTIWLKRLEKSPNVLRERMTLFWSNHFVCRDMMTSHILQFNTTLRTHALGNFKDFVKAISKEASMIKYLNLSQNIKSSPNENFARELLELFTLGEGNYSEKDIKECARAFTGYNYEFDGTFRFAKRQHDYGQKQFFGRQGDFNGDDIIDIILEERQCATYICEKIYSYFVNTNLNAKHIEEMVEVFYRDYNIEKLMRFVFSYSWFYNSENIGTKIKSPIDLIVGIQRMVPVYFTKNQELFKLQTLLDQFLLDPPNVSGWKGGKSWITTNSLLLRIKLPSMILEKESYSFQTRGGGRNLRVVSVKNKYQEKLTVYVDWKAYKNSVKKIPLELLKESLILSAINKGTQRYVNKMGRKPSRKNLVKLMSLPEYQLC